MSAEIIYSQCLYWAKGSLNAAQTFIGLLRIHLPVGVGSIQARPGQSNPIKSVQFGHCSKSKYTQTHADTLLILATQK